MNQVFRGNFLFGRGVAGLQALFWSNAPKRTKGSGSFCTASCSGVAFPPWSGKRAVRKTDSLETEVSGNCQIALAVIWKSLANTLGLNELWESDCDCDVFDV